MARHFVHKNQLKISSSLPPVIDGAIFLQAINPMMHFRSLKTIYQIWFTFGTEFELGQIFNLRIGVIYWEIVMREMFSEFIRDFIFI